MTKRMLIDAGHREETRVAVSDGRDLQEFDVESAVKSQLKGNIYLAKVTRVEPSLQAAFIEYGGNRHGFLAFSEIHPDYFQIPVSDREELAAEQARLVEEAKRESEDDDDDEAQSDDLDDDGNDEIDDNDDVAANDDADDDEDSDGESGADEEATPDAVDDSDETTAEDEAGEEKSADNADQNDDGEDDTASASTEAAERPKSRSCRRRSRRRSNGNEEGDERAESAMHAAILKRGYRIQEVIKRRQILLIQVVKEERGNKGAALTTYLSIAGRYCVLMPNTPRGGGISRKIADAKQRRRLKEVASSLEVPEGMGLIIRTAGQGRTKVEIKRDFNSLLKQWEEIRSDTLQATAPSLIYEEANIIKRAIRDLYAKDIDEVLVEGDEGYKMAKSYMKLLMPSHAARVKPYKENTSLFHRYEVERQLDAMHSPVVQLKSGGYIVINATEALVAIDVNSGRSTKERNIEETAVKTNVEAAIEIARQLRLRDLAGLVVIDFIDMDEHRNERTVERKFKEAVKVDRARIQIGRISGFGLMELSRQRLRPSLQEALSQPCVHCGGSGYMRSTESTVLHVLRGIEDEALKGRAAAIRVLVPTKVALYVLNEKRQALLDIEERQGLSVIVERDDKLIAPEFRIEIITPSGNEPVTEEKPAEPGTARDDDNRQSDGEEGEGRRRKRRRRRRKNRSDESETDTTESRDDDGDGDSNASSGDDEDGDGERKRRRRGKRGGRRRRGREESEKEQTESNDDAPQMDSAGDDSAADKAPHDDDAEETPKPRRRRSRSKAKVEIEDDAGEETETGTDESSAESIPAEASEPSGDAPETRRTPEPEPVAEGVTTKVIAPPSDTADEPEQTTAKPKGPPKRGWWQKISGSD